MKRILEINGRSIDLEWTNSDSIAFRHHSAGTVTEGQASVLRLDDGVYSVLWNGRSYEARVSPGSAPSLLAVQVHSAHFEVAVRDPREYVPGGGDALAHGHFELKAPMPGKVIRLLVQVGDHVQQGQGLVVVEAMKMQNEMRAPRAGVVTAIPVQPGDAVGAGQVLAVID
ncbi:MAG: biotin/lipoyl-containing protein [Bryobacteraceae bacterium]